MLKSVAAGGERNPPTHASDARHRTQHVGGPLRPVPDGHDRHPAEIRHGEGQLPGGEQPRCGAMISAASPPFPVHRPQHGEDLAAPGIDHGEHVTAVPEIDRRPLQHVETGQAHHADAEGLGQALGRGHADPQAGEEPGAQVDRHGIDGAGIDPHLIEEMEQRRHQRLDVAAAPGQRELGLYAAGRPHRHGDGFGGRFEGHECRRWPPPCSSGAPGHLVGPGRPSAPAPDGDRPSLGGRARGSFGL